MPFRDACQSLAASMLLHLSFAILSFLTPPTFIPPNHRGPQPPTGRKKVFRSSTAPTQSFFRPSFFSSSTLFITSHIPCSTVDSSQYHVNKQDLHLFIPSSAAVCAACRLSFHHNAALNETSLRDTIFASPSSILPRADCVLPLSPDLRFRHTSRFTTDHSFTIPFDSVGRYLEYPSTVPPQLHRQVSSKTETEKHAHSASCLLTRSHLD